MIKSIKLIHTSGAGPWHTTRVPAEYRKKGASTIDPAGGDMANCPALWESCGLSEYVPPAPEPPTPTTIDEKIQWVKDEANRRITQVLPEHRQRNATARSAELIRNELRNGQLTAEEQQEEAVIEALWNWVKSVRAYSDLLETQVTVETTFADIQAADWPEV